MTPVSLWAQESQDSPAGEEEAQPPQASLTEEEEHRDPRSLRVILIEDFQLSEEAVDDLDALEAIANEASESIARANDVEQMGLSYLRDIRQVISLLRRQLLNDSLPTLARQIIVTDLTSHTVDEARQVAENTAAQAVAERQEELRERVENLREELRTELGQQDDLDDQISQLRIDEAEEAHQDALRRVAEAMRREQDERDEQLRALRTQERELAEELAAVALREGEQVRLLDSQRRERATTFAEARSEINELLLDIPTDPDEDTARELVDPLFQRVVRTRREARRDFYEHRDRRRAASQDLASLQDSYQDVLAQDAQLRSVDDNSEQLQRRLAISQIRVQLAERELQMGRDVLASHQQKRELLRERVDFYHETVESLVPRISRQQRSQFYSLRSDENWQDAADGFRHAADQIRLTFTERIESITSFPERIFTVSTFIWLFGFLWRLLLFGLAVFIGREYSTKIARRSTDALLSRRFFRNYASTTIKLTDFLGSMIQPALLYTAAVILLEYSASAWPEFLYFRWVINAIFIYWTVMTAVQVMIIPRRFRQGNQTGYDYAFEEKNRERAHTKLNIPRFRREQATKIVTSTRVILIFGLLAYYLPALVLHAIGHTIVWRIVDRLAVWGLLAVVYVVLSTWRDDIANIFERLASDRMPRAVSIVQEHKTRPWGVLLIGLASLYVSSREAARIGRAYFVRTEWNRRLANFFFRKKIELQTRDREDAGPEVRSEVPDHYRQWFHHRPLADEPYAIERTALLKRIEKDYLTWRENPRNGAVAVVGEQGIGKTSLFNQLYNIWSDRRDRLVCPIQLTDKFNDRDDVHYLIASLFGLPTVPKTTDELISALLTFPPRVLIIDDCHHLFLRRIGGFEAIDAFLAIVNRTDHHHFWVLSFNSYTWSYLNRVQHRGHFFIDVINLEPWKESEIQEMIQQRDQMDDMPISFTELIVAHQDDEDQHYEIIRTSNGYFRLLHEFSRGNPRVALTFWIRSLRPDNSNNLQVELFRRPALTTLRALNDDYIFALATIALHGCLRADEISKILNLYQGECQMIVDYLADSDIVDVDPIFQRASIRSLFLRSVLKTLQDANVLYT